MNYSRAGNPKTLMQYFSRKLLRMMMMVVMLMMMMVVMMMMMMMMMMVVMMTAFYVSHLFECYGVSLVQRVGKHFADGAGTTV